jgi:hypothetical protein
MKTVCSRCWFNTSRIFEETLNLFKIGVSIPGLTKSLSGPFE